MNPRISGSLPAGFNEYVDDHIEPYNAVTPRWNRLRDIAERYNAVVPGAPDGASSRSDREYRPYFSVSKKG